MSQGAVQTTVVIPVWDAYVREFLTGALRSIRDQDVPAHVVVVDNASRVAVTGLPDVTLLSSPERLSLGRARNLGLSAVTSALGIAIISGTRGVGVNYAEQGDAEYSARERQDRVACRRLLRS